jgi:hypothetical protein
MNAEFFTLAFAAALNPKLLAIDLLLIENRRPRAMFLCLPLGGYLETWVQDRVRPDSVQVPGGMLPHCGCPPLSLAWLTHGLLLAGHRAGRGSKGVCPARSSNAILAGQFAG